MLQFGFDVRLVNMIMLCVTSVQYSILVSGVTVGPVIPHHCLRQCDLLSPYLYILYVLKLCHLLFFLLKGGVQTQKITQYSNFI